MNSLVKSFAMPTILFCLAFAYCLVYGRIGFNPLDSSIVFDGGWRILSGQKFFVDFYSPNGFVPIIIQSWFFKLLGTNWFAYCIHAAVFNGLFVLVVFQIFKLLSVNKYVSILYAVLSVVVFYPPFGTPYMDQHSFFFSILSLYLLLKATTAGKINYVLIALVPISLFLGILSKQIPSILFSIPILTVILYKARFLNWKKGVLSLLIGGIVSALVVLFLFDFASIKFDDFLFYLYELPSKIGQERINESYYEFIGLTKALFNLSFKTVSSFYGTLSLFFIWIPIAHFIAFPIYSKMNVVKFWASNQVLFSWLIAVIVLVISNSFIILTANQEENGVGLYFLSYGLFLHCLYKISQSLSGINKHILLAGKAVISLLILFSIFDAYNFHNNVVVKRKVHDFRAGVKEYVELDSNQKLKFLIWSEPWIDFDRNPEELIDFLDANSGSFYLFGDLSFLNGVMSNESVSPVLWWHKNLSFPDESFSDKKSSFDNKFLSNIKAQNPRFIIFDSKEKKTFKGVLIIDFPIVNNWIKENYKEVKTIGAYTVLEKT